TPTFDIGSEKVDRGANIFAAGRPRGGGSQAVRHGDADAAGASRPEPDVVIKRRVGSALVASDKSAAVNEDQHGSVRGAGGRHEYVQAVAWIRSVGYVALHGDVGTRPRRERRHQRHGALDLLG